MRSSSATFSTFSEYRSATSFTSFCLHQLIHNLFAQPVDIHRVAARKMLQRFLQFCRASRIHAAVRHFPFRPVNRAAAHRAFFGM